MLFSINANSLRLRFKREFNNLEDKNVRNSSKLFDEVQLKNLFYLIHLNELSEDNVVIYRTEQIIELL
mgnify:CR=1 FL=1